MHSGRGSGVAIDCACSVVDGVSSRAIHPVRDVDGDVIFKWPVISIRRMGKRV